MYLAGNGLKNELLFFDAPFYHAQKPRAWYVSGVKKRIADMQEFGGLIFQTEKENLL